jgi:hypothetical protein
MPAVELLVHLAVVKTTLPDQSRSAQLESGVRRKAPAPFGRGKDGKVLPILTSGETYRKATRSVPTLRHPYYT